MKRYNTARDIAVSALADRAGHVTAHLDRVLAKSALSAADRALARELALGAARRRLTLEAVLAAYLTQPGRKLPAPVHEVFLVALHQILFLQRVPAFAAVNEAVQQTIDFQHRRQSGLVNGILRTAVRGLSDMQPGACPRDGRSLPITPSSYRSLDRRVLPDAEADPAGWLSQAYSIAESLAERWVDRWGLDRSATIAAQTIVAPPLILRVNRLRADVPAVLASLAADGLEAVAHANGVSVVLLTQHGFTSSSAFREGLVQPQDPTATAAAAAVEPRPDGRVLDFCAAPGTKTTYLAELMDNRGDIAAVDVSPEKLQKVEENCKRLGIGIVRTIPAEQMAAQCPADGMDAALVDAPCSNSGVLARRVETRRQFDASSLGALAADQVRLAEIAAVFVRPGGRLVYSTCSIEPEENQQVIAELLRRNRTLRKVREQLTLPAGADDPTRWHDGGYYAVLRKN